MIFNTIKKLFLVLLLLCTTAKLFAGHPVPTESIHVLFENYFEERLKLYPLDATGAGDNRYNNILQNEGSAVFLKQLHAFYSRYQKELTKYNPNLLKGEDKISYYIFKDILNRELEGEKFHKEWMPFAQFFALPLTIGQLGGGTGNQPFKTVQDYNNWLQRIDSFSVWTDTTIANFRKGIKAGIVLPKSLVIKMVPQMRSLGQPDTSKNIFFGPVKNFPPGFSEEEKKMLTEKYFTAITTKLITAYKKLGDFFDGEYLAAARNSTGFDALPNGDARYRYAIYYYTTTRKTPSEIYQTGLNEVSRIKGEMEKLKSKMGFSGSLKELFTFMQTDKQFMPFKTVQEVLDSNRAILAKIEPQLKKLFSVAPKTAFEIRAVESFRAAAASPQYNRSSADGSRPGIYYIPIVDPTKINVTNWAIEATFLHEAIPGHHYQISLTQENTALPKFRRFAFYPAFSEGWALYCESLGEQLGCYTDPYQKMGAYGNEIHRAIRLVVDVAMNTGKMTREDAIKYMMDNEAISEQNATAEIERYMAMPGQALAYKMGELKIKELRDKYQKQLAARFSLKHFHDAVLKAGAMPLYVLDMYMADWAMGE